MTMNAHATTRLRLDAQRSTLAADPAPEVVLAVGARGIAGGIRFAAP